MEENLPTLLTFGIENLKSELMNDPNFRSLLAKGYVVATALVLVNGPVEGGAQTMRLGLIMVCPVQPPPAMVQLPPRLGVFAMTAMGLLALQVVLLAMLLWAAHA